MATTKEQMIAAVADVATAAAALDGCARTIRDAYAGLKGEPVQTADVIAGGSSVAALSATAQAAITQLPALIEAVDAAVVAADTAADGLA
jgi:hypothetical protein